MVIDEEKEEVVKESEETEETEVTEEVAEEEQTADEGIADEESGKEKGFFAKKKAASDAKKLSKQLEEKDKQIAAMQQQADEQKDKYLRLAAEFENYKKRTLKEMDCRYGDAKADAWKSFLPVVDNFERALNVETGAGCEAYKEGINLIYKQLIQLMKSSGVEEIPALNEHFDPNYHNAVMHIEDETMEENIISEVFVKGFKIGDRVLRFSMVKVVN